MRKIGLSEVNYFEFQLGASSTVYRIPLAAYMPYKVLNSIRSAADTEESFPTQVEMLRMYMGDIVDDLNAGTMSEILLAWSEASVDAGASLGES